MLFHDRTAAGQALAEKLLEYAHQPDVIVLGLPRGGVVVAYEVARALHAPLDVFVVRKLGVPDFEELAMGAIASGGTCVLDRGTIEALGIPDKVIASTAADEREELERRERLYRGDRPPPDVRGRTVIVVDDGLATGSTMRAVLAALRQHQPVRLVVAVPVGAPETCAELASEADAVVCVHTPTPFMAVGLWYDEFAQTTDREVRELLDRAAHEQAAPQEAGAC